MKVTEVFNNTVFVWHSNPLHRFWTIGRKNTNEKENGSVNKPLILKHAGMHDYIIECIDIYIYIYIYIDYSIRAISLSNVVIAC
jgi:hypothetical protein